MNSIALLVLLDAFRPDYLARTHFLRDLSRRGGVGAMEEPFGFLPRASYFGGLTPNDTGYSNIFAREPWRSPFPAIPGMDRILACAGEQRVRARLVHDARTRLPEFGARYVDGFAIPIRDLASYAVTETLPPWGPRCGYPSLFQILDEAGLPWVQCAWPYTRDVAAADRGIVATLLDQLTEATRFGFVHLSQLDAIGHESGPGSTAMQEALAEVDAACALIHDRLHECFDHVRILFFGDHGMVTVVRSVDIQSELQRLGLVPGTRFRMFVDSPMVRCWFRDDEMRSEVRAALDGFDFGQVLDSDTLARHDADRMRPGNGELFFSAYPGVVFGPNAFQETTMSVRGMHGYLPDVPDNRGVLVSYDSRDRTAGSLGIASATRIFPTCLQMCGLESSHYTALPPLRVTPAPRTWTRQGRPTHEARVDADLARVKSMVAARAPASAIAITGSFGRGEGGVIDGPDGIDVLNDYDVAVIGPDAGHVAGLGAELAVILGTDFCDVLPLTDAAGLGPSQLSYDLRYGSRVIAGDPRVLDRLPPWAPAAIGLRDAARLLMNRVAGVMLVRLPDQHGSRRPLTQFALNQLTKAWVAVGDAHLIRAGDYTSRCADRLGRFSALAPALGLDARAGARIAAAYEYKLCPTPPAENWGARDFAELRALVGATLGLLAEDAASGLTGWELAVAAALDPVTDAAADDGHAAERLRSLGFDPGEVCGSPAPMIRRALLEGVLALFRATCGDAGTADRASVRDRLKRLGCPAVLPDEPSPADEEIARLHLANAWRAVCH